MIMYRKQFKFYTNKKKLRGSPLDIGGAEVFACPFSFISQERFKALFFSPKDRLEIFISIFILYLCQPPVWVKYLFPPYLVAIHLFHPFFLQKYLFPKNSSPPPSILMVAP